MFVEPARRGAVLALVSMTLSGFGLACAGTEQPGIYYASGADAVTADGLHRVDWRPFKTTFVKPGADLQRYDKVIVDPATVSYERPPRDDLNLGNDFRPISPNFKLSAAQIERMTRSFHEVFVRELSRSKNFSVATETGPDVLRISGHIVDLIVTTPPLREQDTDETVATSAYGAMTLVLEARDSESGEPLVRIGERRTLTLTGSAVSFYKSDPVANSGAVERQFREWAAALRRELDQFHALRELPEPPPTP